MALHMSTKTKITLFAVYAFIAGAALISGINRDESTGVENVEYTSDKSKLGSSTITNSKPHEQDSDQSHRGEIKN